VRGYRGDDVGGKGFNLQRERMGGGFSEGDGIGWEKGLTASIAAEVVQCSRTIRSEGNLRLISNK